MHCAIKCVFVVLPSTAVETVRYILTIICDIDFKDRSIKFDKQRKQPPKHQDLAITPLTKYYH